MWVDIPPIFALYYNQYDLYKFAERCESHHFKSFILWDSILFY